MTKRNEYKCGGCGDLNGLRGPKGSRMASCDYCGWRVPARKAHWSDNDALAVAEVLAKVRALGVSADEVFVDAYRNGREAGYRIDAVTDVDDEVIWMTAVVCNIRNADGLIVYRGTKEDFHEDGVPTQTTYWGGKRFGSRGTTGAAKLIARHLSVRS